MAQQSMKSSGVMSAAEAKRIAKRSGKKTARNRFKKSLSLYALLIPGLFMIILFHYVPMYGLAIGFKKYNIFLGNSPFDAIRLSPWVGLANWSKLWIQSKFRQAIINTFVISAMKIVIGFPIPIILALMINEVRGTITKRVLQTVMYLPHFISWVVIAGLVYKMLDSETGIVNTIIEALGGEAIPFMREPQYFWGIIIIVAIWKELGWNTIIYLAALSAIPPEQYEAAIVDGANGRQRLWYITLPSIAPTIGLMLIMTVGNLVNGNGGIGFDAVYNLRNALLYTKANTLDYFIFSEGILNNKLSYATALGLAQGVVSLILVMTANATSRKLQGYGAF